MGTRFRSEGFNTVWDALDGNIAGLTLFDYVSGEDKGSPAANMPYGVLEGGDGTPFDNDTKKGLYLDMIFNVLSDQRGRTEVDGILDDAYALLHFQNLTAAAGYKIVDCKVRQTQVFVLEDGKTRHGIMRFRVTIQED